MYKRTSCIGILIYIAIIFIKDLPVSNAQARRDRVRASYRLRNHFITTTKMSQSNRITNGLIKKWSITTELPPPSSTTTTTIFRGDQQPPSYDDEDDNHDDDYDRDNNNGAYYHNLNDIDDDNNYRKLFGKTTNINLSKQLVDDVPEFYPLQNNGHHLSSTSSSSMSPRSFWATISPTYKTGYHQAQAYKPPLRVHPCEHSSCYPATGNLLIGRENRLNATSTCGLNGAERFCIVSHLEEKKCFLCETNEYTEYDPLKNHRIGQIIYKTQPGTREHSWWQSENGKENATIQLDLEAEFHFTHLIIVFATFRPAAMFIERSYDFGRTWHVYKYFAHSCAESFPGIPIISKNITDVVCDHRYSGVEPSKNGEVIFRVLPPHMNIENPYAEHVQNMLKMTNLRINFTKLHNLGDTLLDDRQEIQEKYYYAISNMVVRGSCSCYGHASRCLPLEGVQNKIDMVHGRCECTHNTKGLNCEECEDFFNDLPWKPALGKQTNACKKCNCNNHATSCHFDQAVYDYSGRVSGGVCDNCKDNTQGQHCELCIPFFYKDPSEDIQSPNICKPCDCDPRGAMDDGICDSLTDEEYNIEAGACHCKSNVKGRRCDGCKDGFWNLDPNNADGCESCTCNIKGTINNSGCNMHTGECTCKRLVTGKDCNQCMPETYGLSDSHDGCSPCQCDAGGSEDNFCDVITGQCKCRSQMIGRTCSIPQQNHFIPGLHVIAEAEMTSFTECDSRHSYGNCTIVLREHPTHDRPTWTGPGFLRVPEGNELIITVDDVSRTMTYDVVVRYLTQTRGNWEDARITVIRPDQYDPDGPCANSHPSYEDRVPFALPEYTSDVIALHDVCLEQGKIYKFKIEFKRHRTVEDNPSAQILIDSLALIPRIEVTPILTGSIASDFRRKEYDRLNCNQTYYDVNFDFEANQQCKDLLNTISIYVYDGATACNCNPTGAISKKCDEFGGHCECKPHVIGRQCDVCEPGHYGFGPEGCKACDCNSIGAKDNDCDKVTGQCSCHPNTYGRVCDECQPGFWDFPNCKMCQCNGHASECDARTGECRQCEHYTNGYNCDRCIEGFYGNPLLGSEIGCRPCRCPDTIASGHTHADQCDLDHRTSDMICYCREGYTGPRCDVCSDNYYGNPDRPGGICQPCECNNNIDVNRRGNCDARSGQCIQCLHDTAGDHCEHCRDGYHGDALTGRCSPCHCDVLGTNSTIQYCDRYTGQCPCLQNVEGINCQTCMTNHWKIASGTGCETCNCDPIGSESEQCNPYDGQCTCKEGFGGRQCNQCQANFWGDPNVECHPCECDHYGSEITQCDRKTGQCQCNKGIGGYKCDECDRGYLGSAPYCEPCGECFDNWDLILDGIQNQTDAVIAEAKQIKTIGATGAYTKEFDGMEKKINIIKNLLENTTVSTQDINQLDDYVHDLLKHYNGTLENMELSEEKLQDVYTRITLANATLDDLRNRSEAIKSQANTLKNNATKLQEANIEGALNLTREAWQRVNLLRDSDMETQELNANAERQCRRTEALVNRSMEERDRIQKDNDLELEHFYEELMELNAQLPDLNEQMCDKRGNPCDVLCGGAGCKHCGGLSCEKGAITKAEKALNYVKDTEKDIKAKEQIAEDLIRSLSQAKTNASEAFKKAEKAFLDSEGYLNATKAIIDEGYILVENLTDISNNFTASPDELKQIAEQTLELNLQLDPDEIKKLSDKINETISQLQNVDTIIDNTRYDLERVEKLRNQANASKQRADEVLDTVNNVVNALKDADEAQIKAKAAIEQANVDIQSAKADLDHIEVETVDAQRKASETSDKVDKQTNKLNELKKSFLKNDRDAKDIKNQADIVKESASNAHELATQLQNNYRQANNSLTERAKTSESARERAQQLLQRASKITVDTSGKLKELESMVDVYKTNDKELSKLQDQIDELYGRASGYLSDIQSDAARYRQCTS